MTPWPCVALLIVVAMLASGSGQQLTAGPLRVPHEHGWVDEVEPGGVFVSTGERLMPDGAGGLAGVTVSAVHGDFLDAEVEVLWTGVATASHAGGGVVGRLPNWPPTAEDLAEFAYLEFQPVGGGQTFTMTDPMRRLEVWIVYAVPTQPGEYVRAGITVDYQVDGQPFRLELPARGLMCVQAPTPCEWTGAHDRRVSDHRRGTR